MIDDPCIQTRPGSAAKLHQLSPLQPSLLVPGGGAGRPGASGRRFRGVAVSFSRLGAFSARGARRWGGGGGAAGQDGPWRQQNPCPRARALLTFHRRRPVATGGQKFRGEMPMPGRTIVFSEWRYPKWNVTTCSCALCVAEECSAIHEHAPRAHEARWEHKLSMVKRADGTKLVSLG